MMIVSFWYHWSITDRKALFPTPTIIKFCPNLSRLQNLKSAIFHVNICYDKVHDNNDNIVLWLTEKRSLSVANLGPNFTMAMPTTYLRHFEKLENSRNFLIGRRGGVEQNTDWAFHFTGNEISFFSI